MLTEVGCTVSVGDTSFAQPLKKINNKPNKIKRLKFNIQMRLYQSSEKSSNSQKPLYFRDS